MKICIAGLALCLSPVALAWSSQTARRELLQQVASTVAVVAAPFPASAGLLEDFGSDPTKISQKEAEKPVVVTSKKGDKAIDPTLRASYYYPTAKKRYLPRILKVSNSIPEAASSIDREEWDSLKDFVKDADNAILPMKLYVSSLDGQGLGMTNSYASAMKRESDVYEKNFVQLSKAVQSESKEQALSAVLQMGVAITEYRQIGRLTDDAGNIPSVDEMRRMAMRKPTVAIAQK